MDLFILESCCTLTEIWLILTNKLVSIQSCILKRNGFQRNYKNNYNIWGPFVRGLTMDIDMSRKHKIEVCGCPNYLENCPQCLVTSFNGSGHTSSCRSANLKSDFRADIYAQMPMPLLKMRIENPEDGVYVLNKASGV